MFRMLSSRDVYLDNEILAAQWDKTCLFDCASVLLQRQQFKLSMTQFSSIGTNVTPLEVAAVKPSSRSYACIVAASLELRTTVRSLFDVCSPRLFWQMFLASWEKICDLWPGSFVWISGLWLPSVHCRPITDCPFQHAMRKFFPK